MSEIGPNDVVSFVASIPPSSSAIKFDGEAAGGGTLTLLVPGTDEKGLQQMLLLRGRRFLVTAAVMQIELPLQPAVPDDQELLFPTDPAMQPPLSDQAAALGGPTSSFAPSHEDEKQEANRPRRVRRGAIASGRKKAKA